MTVLFAIQLFRCIDCPFSILQGFLKESNGDEVMKYINVQREVEYCQKNEKIEDLCPRVCMFIRELYPVFCLVFYPGTC